MARLDPGADGSRNMRQFHCHLDSFPDAVLGEYVNLALARFSLRHHNPKLHTAGFPNILYLRAKKVSFDVKYQNGTVFFYPPPKTLIPKTKGRENRLEKT